MSLFVTWYKKIKGDYDLRGCLGTFSEDLPISEGLKKYAIYSAFQDKRFNPVTIAEISLLKCGVSLLHSSKPAKDLDDWVIGKHGVTLSFEDTQGHHYSATYLPEIALEFNWSKADTIRNLLHKSGYKKSLSSAKNVKLATYESCKVELTWEECMMYYRSLNRSTKQREIVESSLDMRSSSPSLVNSNDEDGLDLYTYSLSQLQLIKGITNSSASMSSLTPSSDSIDYNTSPASKEKEKKKSPPSKEKITTYETNSSNLFGRKDRQNNGDKDNKQGVDLLRFTNARRDIDLIQQSNNNLHSNNRRDVKTTKTNMTMIKDSEMEQDRMQSSSLKNQKIKEKESSQNKEKSSINDDIGITNKSKNKKQHANKLAAPAHTERASSDESSDVDPPSSSSSCGILSGEDLLEETNFEESKNNTRSLHKGNMQDLGDKPNRSEPRTITHENKKLSKKPRSRSYSSEEDSLVDEEQGNSKVDRERKTGSKVKMEVDQDQDQERIKQKIRSITPEKNQSKNKSTQKYNQPQEVSMQNYNHNEKEMGTHVAKSTQRERELGNVSSSCYSPMNVSPVLSTTDVIQSRQDCYRNTKDTALKNDSVIEMEMTLSDDHHRSETMTNKYDRSNDGDSLMIFRKPSSEGCRNEEKRVNNLIVDDEASEAIAVSEEV